MLVTPVQWGPTQSSITVHCDSIWRNACKVTSHLATLHLAPQFALLFQCQNSLRYHCYLYGESVRNFVSFSHHTFLSEMISDSQKYSDIAEKQDCEVQVVIMVHTYVFMFQLYLLHRLENYGLNCSHTYFFLPCIRLTQSFPTSG
jgi:hypothetical protein